MKKILVRAPNWLGDAVVSTIFLTQLKEREREAEIDVLSPAYLRPVYETHPAVTKVLSIKGKNLKDFFETVRVLKNENFDEAYVLPRSFRSALEMKMAQIPKRIGYAGDMRGWLLTEVLPYEEKAFYPHRYLKLIGRETIPLEQQIPFFPKSNVDTPSLFQLDGISFGSLKKPFLGLAPASVAPARTWEAERFGEVANKFLREQGGTVFILGSAKEKPVAEKVKSLITGSVVDAAGALDLPHLGWLVSQLDALVANDSGLMHVASAFKIPTVVLFGPSDPTYAVPRVGRFIAIQKKEIFCVPCLRNHCVRMGRSYKECLTTITSAEVYESLRPLLNKK